MTRLLCMLLILFLAPAMAQPLTEESVLYQPHRGSPGDPPPGVREIWLKASDGTQLQAWWLAPAKQGVSSVVYFHGNGGNLNSCRSTIEIYRQLGLGLLAFDYRGYGLSGGTPGEAGLYLDGLAAYDFCRQKSGRIYLHGYSLGGAVASLVATQRQTAGLVLESTFTDVRSLASLRFGMLAALQVKSEFNTLDRIKALRCPILIFHGTLDTTIPVELGKKLHQETRNSSQFCLVEGAGHGNLRHRLGPTYLDKLRKFFCDGPTSYTQYPKTTPTIQADKLLSSFLKKLSTGRVARQPRGQAAL